MHSTVSSLLNPCLQHHSSEKDFQACFCKSSEDLTSLGKMSLEIIELYGPFSQHFVVICSFFKKCLSNSGMNLISGTNFYEMEIGYQNL